MSGLVEHILRASAGRFRAHSCAWRELEEVTVPSAQVDDATTAEWSAQMYARDLEQEPKPLTGEEQPAEDEPIEMRLSGDDEHVYTPDDLDALKYGKSVWWVRRLLTCVAFGGLLAGSILTAGRAGAEVVDGRLYACGWSNALVAACFLGAVAIIAFGTFAALERLDSVLVAIGVTVALILVFGVGSWYAAAFFTQGSCS